MIKLTTISFLLFLAITAFGQADSSYNVLLVEKGHKLNVKEDMASFSKTGFYLYRNCVYEVDLKNKTHIAGRLINIKADTLFFTNFFNSNAAYSAKTALDTIAVFYKDLDKLNLIADRAMRFYDKYSFDNFDFIFTKDTIAYKFPSDMNLSTYMAGDTNIVIDTLSHFPHDASCFQTTGINNYSQLNVNIYPNPTTGLIQLEGINTIYTSTIYNSEGKVVYASTNESNAPLNIQHLNKGIYYLQIKTKEDEVVYKKIVRQ